MRTGNHVRRRARGRARECVLLLLVAMGAAGGSYRAAVAWWDYPQGLRRMPLGGTLVEDRHGVPLAAFVGEAGQWHVTLSHDEVSPHLLRAVVAVEDARFYRHGGVDWWAVGGAVRDNLLGERRGASTITMQVHRLRDRRPRSVWWKIEQAIRAEQIEQETPKEQIVLEYLNRASFGGNLTGAGAASWMYFGKRCVDLSLGEAALLAGLPQNPERLRPDRFAEAAARRRAHVLRRMVANGFVTAAQAADAQAEPIEVRRRVLPQDRWGREGLLPTLVTVRDERTRHGGIRTTLDADVQSRVAAELRDALDRLKDGGVTAGAAVVLDVATADVLAAVSLCDAAAGIDLTRRPRSTGSVLKPFIYASAFDARLCAPATMVDDSPAAWAGYVPHNYDDAFRGRMSAATALASSRNLPALQLLAKVGVGDAVDAMRRCGLRTIAAEPGRYGLSLAIGGGEATVLEVAGAYATLARGGVPRATTIMMDEPRTPAGGKTIRDESDAPVSAVYRRDACYEVLAALAEPSRTQGVCPEAAALGVAWKTGTSSGHRDAWCAAVTYRHVVVVWLGRLRGDGSKALVGAEAAAPLALRLAASLDPRPSRWDVQERPTPGRHRSERAHVQILSPKPGVEIERNPDLPPDRQRVALQASATRVTTLWWLVNGEPIAKGRPGETVWWTPAAGEHEVRVIDEAGDAARVVVKVR